MLRDNLCSDINSMKVPPLSSSKSPGPAKPTRARPATAAGEPAVARQRQAARPRASASISEPAPPAGDPGDIARLIALQLEEDKAENILTIPLAGKSPMADAMIVASGRSARHVAAIADHVARKLKDAGAGRIRVEGLPNADWVLIDAGDVIVHIFRPEVREFYNLERIWASDGASGHASRAAT